MKRREKLRRILEALDRLGETSPWARLSRRRRAHWGILLCAESGVLLGAVSYLIVRVNHADGLVWGVAALVWIWTSIYFLGLAFDPAAAFRAFTRVTLIVVAAGVIAFLVFLIALAR